MCGVGRMADVRYGRKGGKWDGQVWLPKAELKTGRFKKKKK